MCSNWYETKNMFTHHYVQEVSLRSLGDATKEEESVTVFHKFGAVLKEFFLVVNMFNHFWAANEVVLVIMIFVVVDEIFDRDTFVGNSILKVFIL